LSLFKFTTDLGFRQSVFSNKQEFSDILIIGGGVIGLGLARELKKKGAGKVTLLERGQLGREASFAAAGMLSPQTDVSKQDDFFDLCYESRGLYENFAAELKAETGIDIELETSGTLSVSFNEADDARLDKVYEWQAAAGFPVEKLGREEMLQLEPFLSSDIRGGLFFPRDNQVENRLLVDALARSARQAGVLVLENTGTRSLLTENDKITGAAAASGNFFAPVVVLATGAWSSFIKAGGSDKPLVEVAPVRGQMICFHPAEKIFTRVIVSRDGYLVPRMNGRILAGSTLEKAGFDKTVTEEGVEFLRKNAYSLLPKLKDLEITEKWAGLRPCAADELPILGKYKNIEGLFIATAHFRNGILLTPLTAQIMADQILEGKDSRYLEVFSPNRFINAKTA